MFYYIKKPPTQSFPIGLIKSTDFIFRSDETGFERQMLVVAVISVDDYHLLAFSDLTCHATVSSQWGSQKLLQGLVSHELTFYLSVSNLFLTQWIMIIISKGCKPDNFEPHNSLKLSFTNISGLRSNFVEC